MFARAYRAFACSLAILCAGAPLPAHGGQFRGPWNTPAVTPPGGGGPLPPSAGPNTGGRAAASDSTSWQVWWEFNKEELLAGAPAPAVGPVSGSDEFYLGPRRHAVARDSMAPSDADRRDRIAEALAQALATNDNRDIVTACIVALAKVGQLPRGQRLVQLFVPYLAAADQEVRETAALALGIAGQQESLSVLGSLLVADARGKELAGGKDKDVPARSRAFAAWSLGLLGARSRDPALKGGVADLLLARLNDKAETGRDLRVGLIEGLGLLAPESDRSGGEKRLLWRLVEELWRYYEQDLGKGDQLIQAHVPIAVARLLGRGSGAEHERGKHRLTRELTASGRSNQISQSAAMALGSLCLSAEQCPGDGAFTAELVRCYGKGTDQLTRFFAVLSLGRIGGEQNRQALLSIYAASNRQIERPWVALALGLIARERLRTTGVVDADVGRLLLADFVAIEFEDARSAIALALGLCGYRPAIDALAMRLREGGRQDTLLGYLAVALALLNHVDIADHLVAVMQDAVRRPFLLQQCAVALGHLGDARTVPTLLELLDRCQSTSTSSAVAAALAKIRDRRSIEPLIAFLQDQERTQLARAFAAAALGGVGDKDALPWNAVIARDMNWMATVDTLTNGSTGVLDIL